MTYITFRLSDLETGDQYLASYDYECIVSLTLAVFNKINPCLSTDTDFDHLFSTIISVMSPHDDSAQLTISRDNYFMSPFFISLSINSNV